MSHTLYLDHLVIAAATLPDGIAWARSVLGSSIPFGGKHAVMNTHNAVARLDGSALGAADIYLEIIAIDPDAGPPARPRWFGLDEPGLMQRLAREGPRLITWVVRTDNLAATAAASPIELGPIWPMARPGLSWDITICDDGSLPAEGLMPTAIQWPAGPHVSTRMTDSGLALLGLTLHTADPAGLVPALAAICADRFVTVVPARPGDDRVLAQFRLADGREVEV